MKKRWLAMLVVGCMLIGSMGMTVMAENEPDGSNNGATGLENDVQESGSTSDVNTDFVVDENGVLTKYTGSGGAVTIPDNVKSIGNMVFYECTGLTSVTIPDSVTNIGTAAFTGCTGLTSVTIPDSVTSIGDSAFKNCSNLVNIKLSEKLTAIQYGTFWGCSKLANVTIPNSVTKIEYYAFQECALTEISIPKSVTEFNSCIFMWADALTDIYYDGTEEEWKQLVITDQSDVRWGDKVSDVYAAYTIHCSDGVIKGSSSQTTPETPQPEESEPAAEESKPISEEPKKNPGSSSSHNSSGSSQNNKTAPASSAPKTEQEVVKETIENLPQGGQAVLETDSVIGSGELRKIMEKGGSMVVFSPQVSWHFDVLTNGDMDFNPGIEVGADIPDLMQKLNGQSAASANATVIRFAHNGVLPGAAHAGIAVSYAPGTRLYFYYYNRSTGLFEFQQSVTVEEGGYVVVNLTHCSDYVLTTEPLSGNVANGPVPAAGTGSGANGAAQGNLDSTPHTGI